MGHAQPVSWERLKARLEADLVIPNWGILPFATIQRVSRPVWIHVDTLSDDDVEMEYGRADCTCMPTELCMLRHGMCQWRGSDKLVVK